MKAPLLRHREHTDKAPLHYPQCGLENVYLISGYEVEESEDGPLLMVRDIDDLHRAIGVNLAARKKLLTPDQIRYLRKLAKGILRMDVHERRSLHRAQ